MELCHSRRKLYRPNPARKLSANLYDKLGLSKKFVQYVYENFILQILKYINVVSYKTLPIRQNKLVPPPFPLLEAPLEFLCS